MGAAQSARGRPRLAPPVARARRQPSRRPRRWGRLLAAALALVLVAALVPGAHADDGGGVPPSAEPLGGEGLDAETFEATTPVSPEGADGTGGEARTGAEGSAT